MEVYLARLILESSVMYSAIADAVRADGIDRSQFASGVSGQRMELHKALRNSDRLNILLTLTEEQESTWDHLHAGIWQSCIDLDTVILDILEAQDFDDYGTQLRLEPIMECIDADRVQAIVYADDSMPRSIFWRCANCGGVFKGVDGCGICGAARNWFVPFTPPGAEDEPEEPEEV